MKEKKVIVRPDERIVVAMMEDFPKGVVEECEEKLNNLTSNIVKNIVFWMNLDIDNSKNPLFKSVAKCDEFDTFDERAGREIACSVVDKKYHVAMAKKYAQIKKYLVKAIEEISALEDIHNTKANNITEDIKRCYIDK